MKPTTVPLTSAFILATLSAAGISHWWSVREFTHAFPAGLPAAPLSVGPSPSAVPTPTILAPSLAAVAQQPQNSAVPTAAQKDFFENLVKEVKTLRSENLNLVDQMAETNRDLMKLEFRVDTHSESFRPLPVSEERNDTSLDDGPGVLPPRAEPVFPTSGE
jgi:hypothetical protein